MERNENDIFDELVRGKLTNYTEPTEPEWIRAIQVKKSRAVSLYQLYKLMLVAIIVGAGIFAGIQLMPYQPETQATTLQQQEENALIATPLPHPDAAEFASASSETAAPVNTSVTGSTYTYSTSASSMLNAGGAAKTNTTQTTGIKSTNTHNKTIRKNHTQFKKAADNNKNGQSVNQQSKAVQSPSASEPKNTEQPGQKAGANDKNGNKADQTQDKPETQPKAKDDTKSKEQAANVPCKAAFDFYTSYSGEFNFVHLAPIAEDALITWSFGDGNSSEKTNASHLYQSSGTYEVTLTIQNGKNTCSTSKAIAYQNPAEKTTPITISGKVIAGSATLKNAVVELYAFDEQKGKFKSAQTIRTNQLGEYSIMLQRNTRYLLKGYPTGEAQHYLASYWGNTTESENATEIQIMPSEKDNLVGYTIQLLIDENQQDNDPIKDPVVSGPSDFHQVFLVDANNNIVSVGSVDANGNYSFGSSVEPGDYNIVNPGTGVSKPTSVSGNGDGLSGNISSPGSSSLNNEVIVYPNPASSVVNFGINSDLNETATLVIMDASGVERSRQKILFSAGFNQGQYDLSSYSPGVYYIMIFRNNQQVSSNRIVKLADTDK